MNFNNIPLFGAMKSQLGYLSERQSVLAQNIANADTPEYQAKDVQKPDFNKTLRATQSIHLATTNEKHFAGSAASASSTQVIKRDSTFERNPNGNNVVIEEEMAKVAQNQSEYQKVINIYRKSVDMFRTAIGKTGG